LKLAIIVAIAALLAGCSSTTKLGGMAYCPVNYNCSFTVTVPAAK
jgi:hypothetical protein